MNWKLYSVFLIPPVLVGFVLLAVSTSHAEVRIGRNRLTAIGDNIHHALAARVKGGSDAHRAGQNRVFRTVQVGFEKAELNFLITNNSVGPVRLGMTVAQARRVLSGLTLSRTFDGEGIVLIAVKRCDETVMTLYAGEQSPKSRLDEHGKIEFIEVWSASYHTAIGVHPRMHLREVEQWYGRVTEIRMSEIEAREFATLATQPRRIHLRVTSDAGMAGIYNEGQNTTTRYAPSTYVKSISITGGGQAAPQLSSGYTDLREMADNAQVQQTTELNRGQSETLEDFARRLIPQGMLLSHQVLEGRLGSSGKSMVILFESDRNAATSYKGFVLAPDSDGYEKYELPEPQFTWSIEKPTAVFFANADKDAEQELFIIGKCYTGVGPTGGQPFNRTRVYDWSGNGFTHLEKISQKIGTAATQSAVRKKLAPK
jgi:hypothetical protein